MTYLTLQRQAQQLRRIAINQLFDNAWTSLGDALRRAHEAALRQGGRRGPRRLRSANATPV